MKLNRKGFTLIELLVTIVIVGLVIGLTTFGIISVVNNSKNKSVVISESSLKDAARIYSTEMGSDSWKETTDFDAFCVTVGELRNKGLIEKNGVIDDNKINDNTYIIVKRDKVTLSVQKEEITNTDDSNFQVCTGTNRVDGESIVEPIINGYTSYTDRIELSFTDGSASYNGEDTFENYKCLYGESSSNINREGIIEGNRCVINNLKDNTPYWVYIYMNTKMGSSVLAIREGGNEYTTKDFAPSTFTVESNHVTINYDNENVLEPSYYFYSTSAGISNFGVKTCSINNDTFSCDNTNSTVISANTWYQASQDNITINYQDNQDNVKEIELRTRILDGSNNYREDNNIFERYMVTFYKNNASSIGNTSSESIKRTCIATKDSSCSIVSPSIKAPTGYSALGWNTNREAKVSNWDIATEKEIDGDASYYAIIDIGTYTITTLYFYYYQYTEFKQFDLRTDTATYGSSFVPYGITAPTGYYLGSGYGYYNESTKEHLGDGVTNSTSFIVDQNKIVHVYYYPNEYTISYDANGGNSIPGDQTKYHDTPLTLSSSITRDGYNFVGWKDSDGDTYFAGEEYTKNKSTTMTAQWTTTNANYTINHYKMNIDGSYSDTASESEIKNGLIDSNITLSNLAKSYTGFTYSYGTTNGTTTTTTTILADGSRVINLYYSRNQYTVTLTKGTGISSVSGNGTYYYGTNVTINATVSSGYKWSSWSGTHSTTYQNYTFVMPNYNVSDTANANTNAFTVTYDLNITSGNASMSNGVPDYQTKEYGVSLTLSSATPIQLKSKSGYHFIGWNTNRNGTGVSYNSGGQYNDNADITLYAQWHQHQWYSIGNTLMTGNYGEFTCGYTHSSAYYIYCNDCGMSVVYYNNIIDDIAPAYHISSMACPCKLNLGSSTKYVNDSNIYKNVSNQGGTYYGGSNLSTTSKPAGTCVEHPHYPTISVTNTTGSYTGAAYSGSCVSSSVYSTITYSDYDIDLSTLQYSTDNTNWYNIDTTSCSSTECYYTWSTLPKKRDVTVYYKICNESGYCSTTSFALCQNATTLKPINPDISIKE